MFYVTHTRTHTGIHAHANTHTGIHAHANTHTHACTFIHRDTHSAHTERQKNYNNTLRK